ncbi:MAG: class I SAM-dependent DNA methyltransferase [Planctomycetota bacterium]|jgi:SAM-dependent methyltransferase
MSARLFNGWAPYYDLVYAAKGKDYAAEAARIVELCAPHFAGRRRSLLDVACGTGAHLRHLQAEFEVSGVDGSAAMLAVARDRLPGVRLLERDMTTLQLHRSFDVITCLFASIGYLPDADAMRQAVRAMASHLVEDGTLILEPALTPERIVPPRRSVVTARTGDETITCRTDAEHLPGRPPSGLVIRFEIEVASPTGVDRYEERQVVRAFTHRMYEDALRRAGLRYTHEPVGLCGYGLYVARRDACEA